jgi:hypothetical protein
MKNKGLVIARRMHKIKLALISIGVPKSLADLIAFHLADMQDDVSMLSKFIASVSSKKRIKQTDFVRLGVLLHMHTS